MSTLTAQPRVLPLPDFYQASHARDWGFQADALSVMSHASDWRRQYAIKPAGSDRSKIHLLLIDVQKDFCFPTGTLYVGGQSGDGAMDDNDRIATFIYQNLPYITDITCTMDTHFPYQIFFPSFWLDGNGQVPPSHTEVSTEQIRSGALRPNPAVAWWLCSGNYAWLQRQERLSVYLWGPLLLMAVSNLIIC